MNQVEFNTSFLINSFRSNTLLIDQERFVLSALEDAEKGFCFETRRFS